MAKFPFTVKRVLPHTLLLLLFLLQARHGYAAPTHHLTVSVEGNTPTLIVTSAEIGITPKIVQATTIATPVSAADALTMAETSDSVITPRTEDTLNREGSGASKFKGKSAKMQYSKKWQQAMKEREKKEKLATTQASLRDTTTTTSTNTEVTTQRSETTFVPPKYSLKTTKRTTAQTFDESTQATETEQVDKANLVTASTSSMASTAVTVNDKPKQVGVEPSAQDVVNTPDAIMSTAAGNMPPATEPTTRVTLASSTRTKATTAAWNVEETKQPAQTGLEAKVTLASIKTLAEEVTTMSTFTELHDTTAAVATKRTSSPNTPIATAGSSMATQAKYASSSSTTSSVPMITDAIETLPKAIKLMVITTTTPVETTTAAEIVTNAFAAQSNTVDITKVQTSTTTTIPEYSISSRDVGVNQNVPTKPRTESISTTSQANEKVYTNKRDNLETSHIPISKNKVIAIKPTTPINVNGTPKPLTTTTEIAEMGAKETSTLISSTTTIKAPTTTTTPFSTVATTKSELTKQATIQKVDADSGIIFIDDASDKPEDRPNGESSELQNDEAIPRAERQDESEVAHIEEGEGVNDSKGVIKLIDLEKHDLKSISKAKQQKMRNNKTNSSHYEDDDGHDGVKRTKKKQLTDKHYLVDVELNVSAEIHEANSTAGSLIEELIETTTPGQLRSKFVETTNSSKSSTESLAKEIIRKIETQAHTPPEVKATTETSSTVKPSHTKKHQHEPKKDVAAMSTKSTLKPVHNGYLGPILMEEKVFSVSHGNSKPHEHHESAIESQLRHGRLVEILAPTALLEQTSTKPLKPIPDEVNKYAATTTTTLAPVRGDFAYASPEQRAPMLSTTVFQVPETLSSTTRLPFNEKPAQNSERDSAHIKAEQQKQQQMRASASQIVTNARTESKISDIQVEVYDSTVDSIVASTNFKDGGDTIYPLPQEAETTQHFGTTKPPAAPQERFTQYVVDRVDYAERQASPAPLHHAAADLPEPAAIEIHINVSEGIGNESEDLEFSYRQPDYGGSGARTSLNEALTKAPKVSSMKSLGADSATRSNESNNRENVERGDEILVVEIIDTGENNTEPSVSAENVNPIFTFRSDAETDVELKDIKYFPPEVKVKPPQISDELFLADMKREQSLPKPPLPPPPPPRKPTIDRDSDTIFYISNTEVKVGESLPTSNTNFEQQQQQQQQQLRKTKLENQFFPANYLASTHPNAARVDEQPQLQRQQQHRYEEDIILSPIQNTADSLKIFRSQSDGAPPLDVTYVGESVMEVEQSSGATTISAPSLMPDVIIQPAILPEMSIGVPVIGELPPQIELKEIDFMPDEANQQHSGMYENNMLEENGGNGNGNDVDRIVESSVQYGGDLIDESIVGGGFDGVEGSYPFGNPVALHNKAHHAADFAHFIVNHGVSNLRKDELSVDVASSGETTGVQPKAAIVAAETMPNNLENGEMRELLERNANETLPLPMLGNGSYPIDEILNNATAKSVMQESNTFMNDQYSMLILILVGLSLFVLVSTGFCTLWIMYIKHQIASVKKPDHSKTSGNGNNAAEKGKSDQESTTSNLKKQQTSSIDIDIPSNGNSYEAMQHSAKPSTYTNNKNMSNGTNGATLINCNAKSVEEVLLLPNDEPIAIPSLNSVSTSLETSDNNKLKIEVNVIPSNNNSVQDDFNRPNGSVTKMTLKNNHLIVETEERHDISRVARETTMHYNNSEKNGVFVVEVARGVDSKSIPGSPTTEEPRPIYESQPIDAATALLRSEDEKVLRNHDEIQIHQPPPESIQQHPTNCIDEMPERSLHQIVEVEEPGVSPNSFRDDAKPANEECALVRNSNTGLSQSDLSSTSSAGSNKRYSYGNQELYTVEPTGYVTTSPTNNIPLTRQSATDLADDDDRRSENGHSLEHSPAAQGNGATATLSEDQVACNKLANNERSGEQAVSESATQESHSVDENAKANNNNVLEIAMDNEQKTSTSEALLQAVVDVKEVVESEQVFDVGLEKEVLNDDVKKVVKIEEDVDVEELNKRVNNDVKDVVQTAQEADVEEERKNLNCETVELVENEKKEDKEEMENIVSKELVNEECINNNNNTTEEMDEELKQAVSKLAESKAELAAPSEAESKANDSQSPFLDTQSKENGECEINDTSDKSIGLTNGADDALHAFPQTIVCNYGYDSIISLPDPPSTEEIKQLAAFTIMDNNQLDSLPPPSPPPPPSFADMNDNTTTTEKQDSNEKTTNNTLATEDEITATQLKLQQILHNNSADVPTMDHDSTPLTNGNSFDTTNGNTTKNDGAELDVNGHEMTNGHEQDGETLTAHLELNSSSSNTDDNSASTPLTPPASPPLSPPLHYSESASVINAMNGVNRGMCNGPLPVAVNVNGS